MSDISANEAPEAAVETPVTSEAPVEAVETDFDLDAELASSVENAPDEWKNKIGKIQSEVKNLRAKYAPLRDTFDGLHEGDREAITTLITAIKSGDSEAAAEWMFEAAKGLTGDQFEAKFGITKAEAAAAVDAVEEAPEAELTVAEQVQKALDERDAKHKEETAYAARQTAINEQFAELGYTTERNEQGHLADFRTKMVAQLAVDAHKGDIKAAHEAFQKMQGDWATAYLKAHSDDQSLAPGQGTPTTTPNPSEVPLTSKDRVKARIQRAAKGAQT